MDNSEQNNNSKSRKWSILGIVILIIIIIIIAMLNSNLNSNKNNQGDKFFAQETVNGVEMGCQWNEELGYVLNFPQANATDDPQYTKEKGALIGTKDPVIAQKIFDYAKKIALTAKYNAIDDIYVHALDYANSFQDPEAYKDQVW